MRGAAPRKHGRRAHPLERGAAGVQARWVGGAVGLEAVEQQHVALREGGAREQGPGDARHRTVAASAYRCGCSLRNPAACGNPNKQQAACQPSPPPLPQGGTLYTLCARPCLAHSDRPSGCRTPGGSSASGNTVSPPSSGVARYLRAQLRSGGTDFGPWLPVSYVPAATGTASPAPCTCRLRARRPQVQPSQAPARPPPPPSPRPT